MLDEALEMIEGFAFEEDGFGEHAVAEAVAGGNGLAFRGYGAAGFCSVDARLTTGAYLWKGIVGIRLAKARPGQFVVD